MFLTGPGRSSSALHAGPRSVEFVIESWARSDDRPSDLLYGHLRMAKEVQLHMWTSVLEGVVELVDGRMEEASESSPGAWTSTRACERLAEARAGRWPVSYTHLTLPTICSV